MVVLALALTAFSCGRPAASNRPPGVVLFEDDFSSDASGWARFTAAEGVMDYDGGGYRILVNTLQANFWATPHRPFADVRLEVDAGKLAGPDENRLGLICRYAGDDYYFLIVSSDGYYGIGIFTGGEAALLGQTEMRSSPRIKTGPALNHLRADCDGDRLALYANGSLLGEVRDPRLKAGDVGLLAGTFSQPGVDVIFDNFVVMKP
jgi:hypothetical protein